MTNRKGYAMVELAISTGIMGIALVFMMGLFSAGTITLERADKRITTQQEARKFLSALTRELKESSPQRIDLSNPFAITFTIPVQPVSGPFAGSIVDDQGELIYGARPVPTVLPNGRDDASIQYFLQQDGQFSTLIRRVVDTAGAKIADIDDRIMANNIESLYFFLDGQTLSIMFTVAREDERGVMTRFNGNLGVILRN